MRRKLDPTAKGALALAITFFCFGAYLAVHPTEARVPHPGSGRYQTIIGQDPPPEHVSRTGARVYGALSMLLGTGIGLLVFRGAK